MAKPPAFQFYANDFMDATSNWQAIAVGLYIRCLCKQWTHGSIPADLKTLARATHCDMEEVQAAWPIVSVKFVDRGDGTLINSRLEEVRERQRAVSQERSKAGIVGAIARAKARANDSSNESTSSKQRKVKEKEKIEEVTQDKDRVREKTQQTPFERLKELCGAVVQSDPERLPTGMRAAFLAYWTEPSKSGKLRWECEKFFDVGRRMDTWRRNEEKRAERFAPASPTAKPWVG